MTRGSKKKPFDGLSDREALIKAFRAGRAEGAPKIVKMLRVLERKALDPDNRQAGMDAQRHISLTLEMTKTLVELESGLEPQNNKGGQQLTIMMMLPDGTTKSASQEELKAVLADVSDSVRRERALPTKGDNQ